MPLQSLSGTATNVTLGSHVGYAPTAQYGPMAVKLQLVTFRLNGRPKSKGPSKLWPSKI